MKTKGDVKMDKAELITTILSVPAEHLYGVSFDEIVERIGKTEQEKLNKAIISAIDKFFKYEDKGKYYQYLEEPWFADIKKSKIPLNAIVIKTGLLESLKGYYSGYSNEKLEDAVGKLHTYMISQLTADSRAAAFIKELEAEAHEQKEKKTQDKRDWQAKDTNDTVHKTHDDVQDIKQMLTEKNSPVPPQPPVAPQTQADNQDYLEHFYDPLFLEDDDSPVTLASMYVSPHLKGKTESIADCVMQWFRSKTRKTCMLLLGNAGVGKSSLVSKIIADANPKDGAERV